MSPTAAAAAAAAAADAAPTSTIIIVDCCTYGPVVVHTRSGTAKKVQPHEIRQSTQRPQK